MLKILTIVQALIDKGEKFTLELNNSGELKLVLGGSYIVTSNAAVCATTAGEILTLQRFNAVEFETMKSDVMHEVIKYKISRYNHDQKEKKKAID